MRAKIFAAAALAGALSTACGNSNCDKLKEDATKCYDSYCGSSSTVASTAFCGCWKQGKDINSVSCQCMPRDFDAVCDALDLSKYQGFNCSAATNAIGNYCRN
jgi:hypothetical protein